MNYFRISEQWALLDEVKLFAEAGCWNFVSDNQLTFESYGCGPGGFGDILVPDTVWFLSIKNSCRIHDWYYRHSEGASEALRISADRIMKNNAIRIVRHHTVNATLTRWRLSRVKFYYDMIHNFGAGAYWESRNV